MKSPIKISNRTIGPQMPCFIIAEAGVNHNGDIVLAKKLIDAAKNAGVDAVKFQTFKTEAIVTPAAPQAEYQSKNIGKRETQFDMLKRLELSYNQFRELEIYCKSQGIMFLSTPHSCAEDVDLIAELCPAIKIGSGDLTNIPLLEYAAKKALPMIIGTGMATMEEVCLAQHVLLPLNKNIIFLHCTTNYPTPFDQVNLRAMDEMDKKLETLVGYSDHTMGIVVPVAARALGACVIEKHFTLDRNMPGPDHKASLEPTQLKEMVVAIRYVEAKLLQGQDPSEIIRPLDIDVALGDGIKKPAPIELETAKVARKSIMAAMAIPAGAVIKGEMLAVKRPGTGIPPIYFNEIVGRTARQGFIKDELISGEKLNPPLAQCVSKK